MEAKITIPLKEYTRLREHVNLATKALDAISKALGENTPQVAKRETKKDKLEKYSQMIGSGTRGKKPEHLKRK